MSVFFSFPRRSIVGTLIPTWLTKPGPVFLKRHVRNSKTDSLVGEVDLLEANTHYAHVRFHDGRETTVATKHLASMVESIEDSEEHNSLSIETDYSEDQNDPTCSTDSSVTSPSASNTSTDSTANGKSSPADVNPVPLRRSNRIRRPSDRFHF